jgi:hypothetical protein
MLQVAPSGVADDAMKPLLLEVFTTNYRVYGRRKTKAVLRPERPAGSELATGAGSGEPGTFGRCVRTSCV